MKVFKNSINSVYKRVKQSVLPRRIFQFGTIFTTGFIYYNREILVKKIDDICGRYFQYYNEKNTDLQKLVRDSLEIPIENISELFDKQNIDIRDGVKWNLHELLNKDNTFEIKEFPNLKEYKENLESKLNSLKDMSETVSKSLEEVNDLRVRDEENYNNMVKKEKQLLDEIENQKNEILYKIQTLETSEQNLNYMRKQLKDKIKKQTELYSNILKESLDRIESKYKNELEDLRNQHKREIKSFHIDFDKVEKEELGKRELLKNLSDLTKARKNYKEKEIEFFRNKLTSEFGKLISQYDLIKSLNNEHKSVSNQYQQTKLEEYNLLNIFFSFEKVLESYTEKKKELKEDKMIEYNNHLYDTVTNKIKPYLKKNILDYYYSEILKFTDKVVKSEDLVLQENKKFISDYYKSKNSEVLFLIKYLLYKQKETSIKEKETLKKYSELISKNIKELYHYSTMFDDQYTKTLIESADLFKSKLPSKVEIVNAFDDVKNDLFFDLFYFDNPEVDSLKNSSSTKQNNNIFKFLLCGIISKSTDLWLSLYSPFYNIIDENENEIIKKVKAISFIKYYLAHENYSEAYYHLRYLTPNHSLKIKELTNKIELMTKHEMVIDLLETHFTH